MADKNSAANAIANKKKALEAKEEPKKAEEKK